MNTKILIIISLMCASLLTMSCQKNNDLMPSNTETAYASDEDAKYAKPYDPDEENVMVDPIKNYPDPFVDKTTIEYRVDKLSRVSLLIVNESGQKIKHLVSDYHQPGLYETEFDATDLPSGKYTAILTLDKLQIREKMTKVDSQVAPDLGWE